MNTKRGFTLIELLVVIAIIGILASVVLASLNSAREKANQASIKANLKNLQADAALYYDDNGSYGVAADEADCPAQANPQTNVFNGTSSEDIIAEAETRGNPAASARCAIGVNGQSWAVSVQYRDGATWYCTDYTGKAVERASAMALNAAAGEVRCE
jgi:prepilin-type N-terminal cleavage/methylation domain-containing protein